MGAKIVVFKNTHPDKKNEKENSTLASLTPQKIIPKKSTPPPLLKTYNKEKDSEAFHLFAVELHAIISEQQNSDIIQWADNGKSFSILHTDVFADKLLSKTKSFASFERELQVYK